MLTRTTAPITLLLMLIIGMVISGCSDNAPQPPRLNTAPFARFTDTQDPRPGRASDMVDGTYRMSMPGFNNMAMYFGDYTDPESILGTLSMPADADDYYPLDDVKVYGDEAQRQTWLARAQVLPGLLAGSLARTTRGGTRAISTIDYQNDSTGFHWKGTYTINNADESSLNVTGSRDGLSIRLSLTATSDETDGPVGNVQFAYTITISGQVANGQGGIDTVDGTITATGEFTDDTVMGNGTVGETLHSTVMLAINKRVCNQADGEFDLSFMVSNGSMVGIAISIVNDGWYFAPDGYWMHGTVTSNGMFGMGFGGSATITLNLEASDGYHVTLTDGSGTLTDESDNVLATLSLDSAGGYIDFDFSDELNALGLNDVEMPFFMI